MKVSWILGVADRSEGEFAILSGTEQRCRPPILVDGQTGWGGGLYLSQAANGLQRRTADQAHRLRSLFHCRTFLSEALHRCRGLQNAFIYFWPCHVNLFTAEQ